MKKALIVGGASGIGLALTNQLSLSSEYSTIYVVDRQKPVLEIQSEKIKSFIFNLRNEDYTFFDQFLDVDLLMITAGFGHLSLFESVSEEYIINSMDVNAIAPMRLVQRFYPRIMGKEKFMCGIMVSIAGFMSSPFFSVYGASKAALKIFIESINVELLKSGTKNRILNVSPGSIKGTGFNKGKTNLSMLNSLAQEIIQHLETGDDLFIPAYQEVFKDVLERYHKDFRKEGEHSYEYKVNTGRI